MLPVIKQQEQQPNRKHRSKKAVTLAAKTLQELKEAKKEHRNKLADLNKQARLERRRIIRLNQKARKCHCAN